MNKQLFIYEDATMAPLGVQASLLLEVDGGEPRGCHHDHGDESRQLPHEDGEDDESDEGGADGHGGKGQETASDTHELQGLLKALEDGIAVVVDLHNKGCVVFEKRN